MSNDITATPALLRTADSPWWADPRVAPILERLERDGVELRTGDEYFGLGGHDPREFVISLRSPANVDVYFDCEAEAWKLDFQTGNLGDGDSTVQDHLEAASALGRAAILFARLNAAALTLGELALAANGVISFEEMSHVAD